MPIVLFVAASVSAGALLLFWAAALPSQQRDASRLVAHTLEVINTVSTLQADLAVLSSDARGFVVTRDVINEARFEASARRVQDDLRTLDVMTAESRKQQATLGLLRPMIKVRIDGLRTVIGRFASGDEVGGWDIVRTRPGRGTSAEIATTIEEIRAEERNVLAIREEAARSALRRTTFAMIACSFVLAASGGLLALMVLRRAGMRRQTAMLSRLNAELEARVVSRTAQLAASMARQRGYFEHSPIAMFVMEACDDGELNLEDMNPAAVALYGLPRDSTIGRTLRQVWPAAVVASTKEKLAVCLSELRVVQYGVAREINGKPLVLDVQLTPLLNQDGRPTHVLSCIRDVTEQRELERQAIVQAEREAQVVVDAQRRAEAAELETALFRSSPDILFIASVEDRDGAPAFVYQAISPALAALTGLNPDDLIGRCPQECLPADMAEAVLAQYRRCVAERATVSYAASYAMPIGPREFQGSITPVQPSATGRVMRLVGTLRDVTEQNRMEAALRHGQRMETIGRLASGVAHDFNNVLQGIVGGLELILDEVAPGTQAHRFAEVALNSAVRGAYLTHHLLSYARKQLLQARPVELRGLLADMREVLARTLDPHITVDLQVAEATPPLLADRGQLETALLNLAINSAHSMAQGGRLAISARETSEAGERWVVVAVADSGTGMDAETMAQSVEPFFTTKGVHGTGLGLSMVQGFAEQSGGYMRIASVPGEGTTVELLLPVAPAADDNEGADAAVQPSAQSGQDARVLLVDDVPDVLATTAALLEKAGFRVTPAANAALALGLLERGERFDVILSDYGLPDIKGDDLIVRSRRIQPNLPAVIVTGFAVVDDATPLPRGTVVLHKPVRPQQIIAAICELIPAQGPCETPALEHCD